MVIERVVLTCLQWSRLPLFSCITAFTPNGLTGAILLHSAFTGIYYTGWGPAQVRGGGKVYKFILLYPANQSQYNTIPSEASTIQYPVKQSQYSTQWSNYNTTPSEAISIQHPVKQSDTAPKGQPKIYKGHRKMKTLCCALSGAVPDELAPDPGIF